MRGYDRSAVGIQNGANKALGAGDRRPSKLELMRDDYHRKILKEKEEKMVQLYEESKTTQRQAMMRVMARNGSGGGTANGNVPSNGASVRDFFNERRRMEANGMPVPPIDNHYRQAKGYNSPGGWSSRTGSGNSAKKVSAGRDRSQPLAPIRRPGDTFDQTRNTQTKTTYANSQNAHSPRNEPANSNPFKARPQLVKHKPLPPATNRIQGNVDGNNNEDRDSLPPNQGYKLRMQQQKQQQSPKHMPPTAARQQAAAKSKPDKMTDFQKWQLEQNKAREDRLKRLNSQNNVLNGHDHDGGWNEMNGASSNRSRQSDHHNYEESDDDNDDEDEDDSYEDETKRLERELMEKINREQAELQRMQKEREKEERKEQADREAMQKREAAERAKKKKLEEAMRKEEEEEYKRERAQEEKQRKEEEKQRKEIEKRRKEEEKQALKRQQEEERQAQKRRQEEEKLQARLQKQQMKSSRRESNFSVQSDHHDETPLPSSRRSPPLPTSSRQQTEDLDERPVAMSVNVDTSYYSQMAKSSDARGTVGSLAKCRLCGRSFAQDRLKKHQDACKKANKQRKTFDATKHRLEGTGAEKFIGKAKKPEPKKKNNWRSKHEEFIQSLRYAKKVTKLEKEGGDLRNITPPPTTQNPDLVPCPYCNRTFNETAAERHIPRCKGLKTRPVPMNTRRR